jgi:hypothetical protein
MCGYPRQGPGRGGEPVGVVWAGRGGAGRRRRRRKPKEKEKTQALERGGDKTFVRETSLEISTDKTFEREKKTKEFCTPTPAAAATFRNLQVHHLLRRRSHTSCFPRYCNDRTDFLFVFVVFLLQRLTHAHTNPPTNPHPHTHTHTHTHTVLGILYQKRNRLVVFFRY